MIPKTETIYFHVVHHPCGKWIRVGTPYRSKETAKSWTSFVKKVWHGLPTRVRPCQITYGEDGKPDEASRKRLDETFNIEA